MADPAGTVLVVDDEPDMLDLVAQLLGSSLPCRIVTAAAPREALAATDLDGLRVAVLDYRMPGMNGVELAAALKSRFPALKVVILTAYADSSLGAAALSAGTVDAVHQKSAPPQEILGTVTRLLA